MLEIILFSILGVSVGVVAGLLPGIHPNQVYIIMISLLPLVAGISTSSVLAFILSVAVSNVMFNYIPTLFFSVPDPSTVINVLPGHRMVLEGRGMSALYISLMSAFLTLVAAIAALPLFLWLIPKLYASLNSYIHVLIIGLAVWMIMMERGRKKLFALAVFMLSGIWGIVTLNSVLIDSNDVLFPALTGMFGLAGLLVSARGVDTLPTQKVAKTVGMGNIGKIILTGLFSGLVIGILPGIGESQAGVLVSQLTNLSNTEFLGALASINASNLLFSVISFYSLGRIRSGIGAAISESVGHYDLSLLVTSLGVILFSAALSAMLTWFVGKRMLSVVQRANYKLISSVIIAFIVFTVFWLTGVVGLVVLAVSTALGFLAIFWNVKRTSNMGYLMLPTALYFAGLVHVINLLMFA